jgi:predicted ATPase
MNNHENPARRPRVVALVGGPCSGKTTFLRELGDDVITVPESATAILTEHKDQLPVDWWADSDTLRHFQRLVASQQLFLLDLARRRATIAGVNLIVADRGVLDGQAYGGHSADHLVNISLAVLSGLYDRVIFFAPPPEAVYTLECGNNPTRRETFAEMTALANRLRACWCQHPGFVKVDGATWEEKRASALAALFPST